MKIAFSCFLLATDILAARTRRQSNAPPIAYMGTFPTKGLQARRSIFDGAQEFARLQPNVLRRYKHLEKLIGFYDDSLSNITKYWTYGCWCFQMGNFPLRMGNGSPVDNVDKICKRHKECYQCGKRDSGSECLPEETGYRFSATFDSVTGRPNVECINREGTCRRNICECDKAFAERLPQAAKSDDGWTGAHHAHYGGFDSRGACLARINPGPGQGGYQLQCCGAYPDRFPYRFAKDGSGKQCCGDRVFDSMTHSCCPDQVVRLNGNC